MESHYIINRICMMPQFKLLILRLQGYCWYLAWKLSSISNLLLNLICVWNLRCTMHSAIFSYGNCCFGGWREKSLPLTAKFHLFSSFWRVHKPPFYSKVYQTHLSPVLNTRTKKQISGLFLWLKPTAVIHLSFGGKGSLKYSFKLELTTRFPFPF